MSCIPILFMLWPIVWIKLNWEFMVKICNSNNSLYLSSHSSYLYLKCVRLLSLLFDKFYIFFFYSFSLGFELFIFHLIVNCCFSFHFIDNFSFYCPYVFADSFICFFIFLYSFSVVRITTWPKLPISFFF